jgi:hypothetical protein
MNWYEDGGVGACGFRIVAAVVWCRGVPSSIEDGNSKVGSKFVQEGTAFLTEEEEQK